MKTSNSHRYKNKFVGSSAESEAHACVLRHVRRCSRCSQLTASRFPVNRQSFHLLEATGILPALSATLFGVFRCATYLYSSSVFLVTLFCECLCPLCCSCVFWRRCVVCSSVCYLYSSCIFWATFGVWMCLLLLSFSCFLGDVWCVDVCYLYRFRVFWGEKKMVQRIVEVVADYEDRVNLTALCVSRSPFLRRRLLLPVFPLPSIHIFHCCFDCYLCNFIFCLCLQFRNSW